MDAPKKAQRQFHHPCHMSVSFIAARIATGQIPPGCPDSGVSALEGGGPHVHVLPHGALGRGETEEPG